MLTSVPLPGWSQLLRAALHRPPSDEDLAAPWRGSADLAGWLSRSSWSLALIAMWRKGRASTLTISIWLPDYFCNASLVALRQTGAKLWFYPVKADMTPNIAACRVQAGSELPDLFVLVHFFGQPAPAAAVREFCARHGTWLIEDAVHVLRPVQGIGASGDFVLYSPHKHLPIPDGAVLVVRSDGPAQFGREGLASFGPLRGWPALLHEVQKRLGCSASSNQVYAVRWLLKRTLQKLGVRSWRLSATPFAEPLNPGLAVSAQLVGPHPSSLGRRLLAGLLSGLGAAARQRQRRQLMWDALLVNDKSSSKDVVLPAERPLHREWTPYLAAYRADSAAAVATHDRWQMRGLPVTTWPDLPPEIIAQCQRHANAWHLRHSRVYLPVHQSLSARALFKRCRLKSNAPADEIQVRVAWDHATREQWGRWLAQAGRSNLLQSWAYGEAKSVHEGWRVKRGVFYRDVEPMAIVQMLQKRVAGVLSVVRINRGPIFLRPLLPQEQHAVWKDLARLGGIERGRVLTVAPELNLSGSSLVLMDGLGFRQFSPFAVESVWIDLGLDIDALRKRLDGKWRNMLAFSEKTALKLEMGSDDELFDWMMTKYQELMQAKDFSGPAVGLLRNLRKQLGKEEQLLILRAMHDGEPVAGICLARHGSAATYLLGWNGPKGRNLKANQYLLWQGIKYLQECGSRWFDLGGISEENTPGTTAFKLGLNGERYELVGEYWKW